MTSIGAIYAHINELRKSCEQRIERNKVDAEGKAFVGKDHPSGTYSESGEEQDFGHAYVMKKLHKEKTKRMDEEMGITEESMEKKANNGFFGITKKVHPKVLVSSSSHDLGNEAKEE